MTDPDAKAKLESLMSDQTYALQHLHGKQMYALAVLQTNEKSALDNEQYMSRMQHNLMTEKDAEIEKLKSELVYAKLLAQAAQNDVLSAKSLIKTLQTQNSRNQQTIKCLFHKIHKCFETIPE